MSASTRLQALVADNAEYSRRLAAQMEAHRSLAAELATAEAEAAAVAARHAQAMARWTAASPFEHQSAFCETKPCVMTHTISFERKSILSL